MTNTIRILFTSSVLFCSLGAYAASFNCAKATTATEHSICDNPSVSALDEQMAAAYKQARATSANPDSLLAEQRAWLKTMSACGANVGCLTNSYQQRIAVLSPATKQPTPQPNSAAPTGDKANVDAPIITVSKDAKFSEGLAPVKIGSGQYAPYGYIDAQGRVVIKAKFQQAKEFSEGLAPVQLGDDKGGKWVFIDKAGDVKIETNFDYLQPFTEGMARVRQRTSNDEKWGFINNKGQVVIEPRFEWLMAFYDGLAAFRQGGDISGKWGFINTSGQVIIQPQFDRPGDFKQGFATVWLNGDSVQIDKTGQILSAAVTESQQGKLPACQGTDTSRWDTCVGSLRFGKSSKYVGEFKDGKKHGRGETTFDDGTTYVGEFRENNLNGQGTLISHNGGSYVGGFKDNKFTKGKFSFPNGAVYVGAFKDDVFDGQGTFTRPNGTQLVGIFKGGEYVGKQENSSNNTQQSSNATAISPSQNKTCSTAKADLLKAYFEAQDMEGMMIQMGHWLPYQQLARKNCGNPQLTVVDVVKEQVNPRR